MLIKIGIILCLLFLFYQDLRYRAVYWVIFPVLLLLFVASIWQQALFDLFLGHIALNLAFLFLQLLLVSLYFSIKNRRWVNLTREYLGWGDVLFLLSLAFYLSPLNYLLFYILSLALVALITVVYLPKAHASFKVPLAGLQALLFAFSLLLDWSNADLNLQADDWLIKYTG